MTFEKGRSGNPGGRPKGSGYRQQLFRALVDPHKEALFERAIRMALAGNEAMLRMFMDRMLPSKHDVDGVDEEIGEIDLSDAAQTQQQLEAWLQSQARRKSDDSGSGASAS